MKISAITTREQYETVKALGLLSEKDCKTIEARLEKLANKPTVQNIPKVVTKTGELTLKYGERAGQTVDLGIVTEVKEKDGRKWVSTSINTGFGHGKYLWTNPEEAVSLCKALMDHLEALKAAGYQFKG